MVAEQPTPLPTEQTQIRNRKTLRAMKRKKRYITNNIFFGDSSAGDVKEKVLKRRPTKSRLHDANMWREIFMKYKYDHVQKRKRKAKQRQDAMKSKNTVRALIGEHRNTRAAGMPSDRRQDHFEKIVVKP